MSVSGMGLHMHPVEAERGSGLGLSACMQQNEGIEAWPQAK